MSDREDLQAMLSETIQTGAITLASGRTTDFYFDGRLVTLDPRGLSLVSRLSFERLAGRCEAVGGPTSGADPIVAGIGLASHEAGSPLRTFFTRKEAKGHGMGRRIEGPPLNEETGSSSSTMSRPAGAPSSSPPRWWRRRPAPGWSGLW